MSQKKKILIRIGSLRHGGAEKVLVTFLKNLPHDQYEIDLLLNLYSGKYLSEVPDWINIIYLNKGEMITTNRIQDIPKKAARVIYQTALKKFPTLLYNGKLKGKKYDIEFAAIHGMRDEIINSPLTSSKKIVWIHNDLSQVKEYTKTEIKKFFAFDKIMVISEKIETLFLELAENETEKQKIVKIYNPLDTEEILTKAEKPVVNYEFDEEIPTFISVGTVFPQKGFDRLLRVHKKLLNEGFKHKILIVGDGYDFENIKKLKTELQLDDTSTMLGFTDNPYPYFNKADFYILSSRYEGFPTVLFEAITLKKKIIATDVSGVREMLNNGELGLIVENSEDGIYSGMKKALQTPQDFEKHTDKLKDYEMPFNLENSVQKIISILDGL
ncbi:glycosyltransferase [Chryseobacterium sp. Ch-15]|uniref:Glycosyltransferase n=1 Tax=Chryseobacterium muglaense TaxID=2893752 RepID=A0A9Q3UW19_9FLAO|nr:glycosyltransferase [Chryseobacterium muglaense]MBD3903842.1 glycosyltransferase [Chryseobacterium muglaense]MCC9034916.1 glycosyltransferase [Chryseobacterium muglaense]MCM2553181.1 glycosyltransferase [Chryseobacterium muglaense]